MGEGNYALASHRAQSPDPLFTPLDDVAIGATIYITDLENIYTYGQQLQPCGFNQQMFIYWMK